MTSPPRQVREAGASWPPWSPRVVAAVRWECVNGGPSLCPTDDCLNQLMLLSFQVTEKVGVLLEGGALALWVES